MKQQTFSDIKYSERKRKTKREELLDVMKGIIPWDEVIPIIAQFCPKKEGNRHSPRDIEVMLPVQAWLNPSDEGVEDTICDSYALRKFVGINFMEEQVRDATTLYKFLQLLEQHGLPKAIFDGIRELMDKTGHIIYRRTIPDVTIINAPTSTKNARKQRDPKLHQMKRGAMMIRE